MRAAIYARVSTRDKQDTENQLSQLRDFARSQNWTITREYVDHESGATRDRADYREMWTAASRRRFDVLLFWSLDRLTRGGALETLSELNRLAGYGVQFRSYTES
jgi:DNA invertase Pin-like site-specific DNA recombinase